MLAQGLHVINQVRRAVVAQFTQRRGAPGTALIEDDDSVEIGVKKLPVRGRCARTRAAMEKYYRHPGRIARLLEIHGVYRIEPQGASLIRLNGRVKIGLANVIGIHMKLSIKYLKIKVLSLCLSRVKWYQKSLLLVS